MHFLILRTCKSPVASKKSTRYGFLDCYSFHYTDSAEASQVDPSNEDVEDFQTVRLLFTTFLRKPADILTSEFFKCLFPSPVSDCQCEPAYVNSDTLAVRAWYRNWFSA